MNAKEHTLTIDGRSITVKRGTFLIEACKKLCIEVPTLCHNENLKPYGVCRFCQVEVNEGKRTRLVPSCVYEIRKDGLTVTTDSERIRNNRKWLIQLLLARCDRQKDVLDFAAKHGVAPIERLTKKNDDCILCGQCVRACGEIVGVGAIGYERRGEKREVTSPYRDKNPVCIACGTCVHVCPTHCIAMTEENGVRTISRYAGEKKMIVREAKMLTCGKCGNYFLPSPVAEVFAKKMGIDPTVFTCPSCR